MRSDADIFSARPDRLRNEEERNEAERRRATLREAVGRLSANADFRLWLYATLDDLRFFDLDERPVDEFGQGFRYAAHRIVNRILDSREGTDMVAGMHKANLASVHKALASTHEAETENSK